MVFNVNANSFWIIPCCFRNQIGCVLLRKLLLIKFSFLCVKPDSTDISCLSAHIETHSLLHRISFNNWFIKCNRVNCVLKHANKSSNSKLLCLSFLWKVKLLTCFRWTGLVVFLCLGFLSFFSSPLSSCYQVFVVWLVGLQVKCLRVISAASLSVMLALLETPHPMIFRTPGCEVTAVFLCSNIPIELWNFYIELLCVMHVCVSVYY